MFFFYATIVLGFFYFLSARRDKQKFLKFADDIAAKTTSDGFIVDPERPADLCRDKKLYVDMYTKKYLPFSINRLRDGVSTKVFLTRSNANFTTSWNGTRFCVMVEGFRRDSLKFEVNSMPNRIYYKQQSRALPNIVNDEFFKNYLVRGSDGGLPHMLSPEMANRLVELHPSNLEVFSTGILFYKDVKSFDADKIIPLIDNAEWLYKQVEGLVLSNCVMEDEEDEEVKV